VIFHRSYQEDSGLGILRKVLLNYGQREQRERIDTNGRLFRTNLCRLLRCNQSIKVAIQAALMVSMGVLAGSWVLYTFTFICYPVLGLV